MGKLEDLIEKFTNDGSWNSENRDGTHRFDKKIRWIESMVKDYAEKLGMSTDEVVDLVEGKRDYSWPNYYQEANFPGVDSESLYGIGTRLPISMRNRRRSLKGSGAQSAVIFLRIRKSASTGSRKMGNAIGVHSGFLEVGRE